MLLYRETHALDRSSLHSILARVEEFNRFIEDLLVEATEPAELAVGNRALAANILTYLPTIVSLRRWLLRRQTTSEEVIDELTNFLVRGLTGETSGVPSHKG